MNCKICNNQEGNKIFIAREMMFGLKHQFKYFKCAQCGCLQIAEFPDNIADYYKNNYYSLSSNTRLGVFNRFSILKILRNAYAIFGNNLLGKLLYQRYPEDRLIALSQVPLNKSMRILDVGCGDGYLLKLLYVSGFNNLLGIDPYIEKEVLHQEGFDILRKTVLEIKGIFDFVMLHHVFEHVDNPLEVLISIKRLLADSGICLIRIPLSDSYAFETYQENWVQFDAPRHFFLHTVKSMRLLCNEAGLKISKIVYDSTSFQFWGSEQYQKDIPLFSEKSQMLGFKKSTFTPAQIKEYDKKAKKLNIEGKGDQAIFIISKN